MRENAAYGDVDGVYTRLLGPFRYLDAFFQGVAFLFPRIKRIAEINGVELGLQMIIVANFFADRLNNLQQEGSPVAQRPAIFVFAVVYRRTEELCNQIAVRGM